MSRTVAAMQATQTNLDDSIRQLRKANDCVRAALTDLRRDVEKSVDRRIQRQSDETRDDMNAMEGRINTRIDGLETIVNTRMDSLETKMGTRVDLIVTETSGMKTAIEGIQQHVSQHDGEERIKREVAVEKRAHKDRMPKWFSVGVAIAAIVISAMVSLLIALHLAGCAFW
jgi:exonuclease VII small subunit